MNNIEKPLPTDAATSAPTGTVAKALGTPRNKKKTESTIPEDYGNETLLLGFDTEYVALDEKRNKVLSYQFFACDIHGENEWQGIQYPSTTSATSRMELNEFILWVISEGFSQSKIKHWPKRVILIAHFSIADLTGFEDFEFYKSQFDAIRRTFVTVGDDASCTVYDSNRHAHHIVVVLRDSMLLAPEGSQSLKALGELVGVPKLDLEKGEIENMDLLLRNAPERFERYALQDPKIGVHYCLQIMALNRELFGENQIPATLSTIGIKHLLSLWASNEISQHHVLGTESDQTKIWLPQKGCYITKNTVVPLPARFLHDTVATESFHGGRGEQYFFGASDEATWTDYDLSGAYTTAMAMIEMPQWDKIHTSLELKDFQAETLGFARISFKFPDTTRFPCLPVRTEHGLIFPLEGETHCCAPEIDLARAMGANIQILHGVILPVDANNYPFQSFIVDCTKRRKSYPKKSLRELFWKALGNGTYGKTAQGLRKKRRFDTRTDSYSDMPESKITNPYIAATVTSIVRAVIGEILSRLPTTVLVSNVTTDGLLTTATVEEMTAATNGPICRLFSEARNRIVGSGDVIEEKHQIHQVLGMRTRGQATLMAIPDKPIVLAKAGLKPPDFLKNEAEKNDWVVDLFANRTQNSTQTLTLLRNLVEIYKKGGDLARKELIRKISLEFDFKRRPSAWTERCIKGQPHLYFDTVPWQTDEEFEACRQDWDKFKLIQGGVLKSVTDLEGFLDYRSVESVPGLRKSGKDTSLTAARRMFLRAYVRSAWGLDAGTMSYAEVANWLSTLGYNTKKADFENARRPKAQLIPHIVTNIPVVANFIARIKEKFPNFQAELLLKQQDPGTEKNAN